VAEKTNVEATPTFDTLLASDTYKIYVEARGVGQLIRSDSVNELLEPVLKLAAPPKELKTLIKWLNTHADEVMTSRMLIATWPTAKNVPDAIVAIEFESSEAAAKFKTQLNSFLPKLLPTPSPEPSPSPNDIQPRSPSTTTTVSGTAGEQFVLTETVKNSSFHLKQAGSLVLITPTESTLKNLRPSRSKPLSEDPNFRLARNRFTSEQLFLYVDVNGIEKEEQEREKQFEEEYRKREAEAIKQAAENPSTPETQPKVEKEAAAAEDHLEVTTLVTSTNDESSKQPEPDVLTMMSGLFFSNFFGGRGKWPDGIGVGLNLESDSFEVRALLVTSPGEKADAIPFFPYLVVGAPIVPESTAIIPADTELVATLSLDFPQIYAAMSNPRNDEGENFGIRTIKETESAGPFAEIEKKLKIKINEDLLPLLGSEVVVSMPVKLLEDGPRPTPTDESKSGDSKTTGSQPKGPSFVIALSLKDKEGMRVLLPKLVEAFGFKGVSGFAQTERRGETELVSYANVFAYAFIGNFLVVSQDAATTRHVVDSYLKNETLSSDAQFKNYTRWQPRQLQAQVYISPALMESYKSWASEPTTLISDQTREFLSRISLMSQPVTYSLSNDGLGTLHELHIPKSLVLMAVAGISEGSNPSPIVANERATMGAMYMIGHAQSQYQSGKGAGSFGTMEQLLAEGSIPKEMLEGHGYKIDLTVTGNKFTATAVPVEYGKTGKNSYYVDESKVLRGADHGGATATVNDKPVQ
jgi:hypothetical protein